MGNKQKIYITSPEYSNIRQITKRQKKCTLATNQNTYIPLWKLIRQIDHAGQGYVVLYFPKFKKTLNTSRATIYRWLQLGRREGAFRHYRRQGNYLTIYYGSLTAISKRIGAADLEVAVSIPLEEITCNINEEKLRQKTTLHTAQVLQTRSRAAAIKELRANKNRRTKLAKPKFRGATAKPTSQFFPKQKQWGVTQKTLAETLGVSERTIRRHLAKTPRVQGLYKIPYSEGQAEQFYSQEERIKSTVFFRKGEYWKYGTNLYQLDYKIKSRWTARLKYKFELLKLFRSRSNSQYKDYLLIEQIKEFFNSDWFSQLNLEELVQIRNFNKFRKAINRQLRELKRRRTM